MMANPNIPVAIAAPVDPSESVRPSVLTKGRSQRVFVSKYKTSTKELSGDEKGTLHAQGYSSGLIQAVSRNTLAFPLRIWVVDNSGSMSMGDGHRIVETNKANDVRLIECSRWTELQETVVYHAQMASLLEAPTVFRLLNDPGRAIGPQQFSVAEKGKKFLEDDLRIAQTTMARASPSGVTPLTDHIQEIRENVMAMREQLLDAGQKVAIILATDGLPSNEFGVSNASTRTEFEGSLRSLEGLPVWVVVRLCTDEDDVVEYYNNLDGQLELSLEVLDDFTGEAKEVYEQNKWLNYALPLHRIREMGFNHRLFDLLDERPFTLDEVKQFMVLLFGEDKMAKVPDPQIDFKGFMDSVWIIVNAEGNQWNPISRRMAPWVDMKKLKKIYKKGNCTIM
mmetsp:Transcript_96378/g.144257  ORF Transcript_96378/g.144257 Transcript_96378/m.144257 type:complete len:394 (+) Transcript_96378:64-1245(+)